MRVVPVLLIALALSGCATTTPVSTAPIAGDLTGEWAPVAGSDQAGEFTLLPETGTIVFGNNTAMQATGCGMFQQQPLNDDLVITTSSAVTRCVGPSDTDTRIAARIADATTAVIGDTLHLSGPDFELELERVAPVSLDQLQGKWTFTSARQSDMGMGIDNPFTLTVTGSTITVDCVTGTLSPVSGLNVLGDMEVTGGCTQLHPRPLDVVLATPFLVHSVGDTLDLVDVSTSTHYEFTR